MILKGNLTLHRCESLKSLGDITEIEGTLSITNCQNLQSLGNLKKAKELRLQNCSLKSLEKFEEAEIIVIKDMKELISLKNLKMCNILTLENCPALNDLGRLTKVSKNMFLSKLVSLLTLGNLRSVKNLHIRDCVMLSDSGQLSSIGEFNSVQQHFDTFKIDRIDVLVLNSQYDLEYPSKIKIGKFKNGNIESINKDRFSSLDRTAQELIINMYLEEFKSYIYDAYDNKTTVLRIDDTIVLKIIFRPSFSNVITEYTASFNPFTWKITNTYETKKYETFSKTDIGGFNQFKDILIGGSDIYSLEIKLNKIRRNDT